MNAKGLTGVFLLCLLSLHESPAKPSNIFYRVSPPNTPPKLEPVLYAPHFEYPLSARKQHLEGNGLFELRINSNGSVASVRTPKTIGHRVLDAAVISGFRHWRFRPHTVAVVRIPVQYKIAFSSVRWGSGTDLKNVGDGDGVVIVSGKS